MTRFARIHRNNSSTAKIPEKATSWSEFKAQMDRKYQYQNETQGHTKLSEEEYSNLDTNQCVESKWCDFDETVCNKGKRFVEKKRNNGVANRQHDFPIKKFKKSCKQNLVNDGKGKDVCVGNDEETVIVKKKHKHKQNFDSNSSMDNAHNDGETSGFVEKKKKLKSFDYSDGHECIGKDIELHRSIDKKKHKKNFDCSDRQESFEEEVEDGSSVVKKKKHKKSFDNSDRQESVGEEEAEDGSSKDKKKKHKKSFDSTDRQKSIGEEEAEDGSSKDKKKKHKKSFGSSDRQENVGEEEIENGSSRDKKKKHKMTFGEEEVEDVNSRSKKRRRKMSFDSSDRQESVGEEVDGSRSIDKKKTHKMSFDCSHGQKYSGDSDPTSVKRKWSAEYNIQSKRMKKKDQINKALVDGEEVELTKFDGFYILKSDADRFQKLRQNLQREGRPQADVEGIVKRLRRNAEKSLSRKKNKVCFNCREGIHNLSECPKLNDKGTNISSAVCYKCGSTEHSLYQCKVPGNDLKFAKCFVCNESGHLSKQCPDNPRGLYPHGGGCRICGDVTHFKKDCPELIKKKRNHTFTVGTIGDSIECLDEDERRTVPKEPFVNPKPVNKIIKFK